LLAPEVASQADISVNVMGGGQMGQAQACRTAIARALVGFSGSEELKRKIVERDRFMFAEDSRRVEPKKYKGPKARARFQKSYR
jgi:small subunit ribosomal protein S9